jgi:hypothetical protein
MKGISSAFTQLSQSRLARVFGERRAPFAGAGADPCLQNAEKD